jgi:glycine/D-amino acid oxidase-like deaminating enzyme
VAIVGGGITGAMLGQRFAEEGLHTVLLEGREMGYGSTGSSTALLQYELDTHLVDLAARIGLPAAQRCYRLCLEAVEGIGRLADGLGADVDYRRRTSVYLASHRRDVKRLEQERRARRDIGIEVDLLSPGEVRSQYGFDRPAALVSAVAAEADPLRLTHALLAAGLRDGLEIYDRTGVARYQSDRKGVLLETADGWRIRAGKAIFATGCNIPPFFPRRAVRLTSSFVVATSPLSALGGWSNGCLIWETARPYLYARTTGDGRAIVGGADLPFKGARKMERVQDKQTGRVATRFTQLLPDIRFDVDWSWAGAFGGTDDGLPYIGVPPEFPNGYVALGQGANGVVFAYVAARVLLDLFAGRANPDAELFRIGR